MKLTKCVLVLFVVLCAAASRSSAQTVQFLGGGALFLELGQAAQSAASIGTPCVWTQGENTSNIVFQTNAQAYAPVSGSIWVTWSPGSTGTCAAPSGTGINIYAYMSSDSAEAIRCYFVADPNAPFGCFLYLGIPAGTSGANLLCSPSPTNCASFGPDTPIPQAIFNALNGQHSFVAGTEIRPEDASYAVQRLFAGCPTPLNRQPFDQMLRQTYGLGYSEQAPYYKANIFSSFSAARMGNAGFNPGSRNFTVSTIGAQPIVVVASPNPPGGTGLSAATNINGFTLSLFLQGVLGRSTDLMGPTTPNPVTVLVREPQSGAYNTMEFSIPNSSQFHGSQDQNNCSTTANGGPPMNPMNVPSANGQVPGAARRRVVRNDDMVTQLSVAKSDTLGYFFWSVANVAKFTATNGKYLTVNGVDPLQDSYTDGVLPGADSAHPLSNVTFKWLNMGDYPIWSVLRLISTSPKPASVTNLIAAVQTLNSTQYDFIPLSKLQVWHSHFSLPAINQNSQANGTTIDPATPGDLCNAPSALAEIGGDAGGATLLKLSNHNFCQDFAVITGFVNKTN